MTALPRAVVRLAALVLTLVDLARLPADAPRVCMGPRRHRVARLTRRQSRAVRARGRVECRWCGYALVTLGSEAAHRAAARRDTERGEA
ncbi:hypothetical protein [Actinomadura rupiterrae]|uniref:hypothetical protein n=1 Tax=Actinomadura rupiterrae TaxID=559627 RepID=UPI0020A51927|nr:hypothetical protein [Actinomadura rupiterrae]MCP2339226.1 hypothetical protein [Actinomadura rupiterrae]